MHPLFTQADAVAAPLVVPGQTNDDVRPAERLHPGATYRPDIDGLRALAIIAVVLFHSFPSLMPGGFVGVDVFFVISGFLISNILLRGLENGAFSFTGFYANRIRRLFPALLVVLAACFVVGWWVLLPDEYERLGKNIVGAAAYIENIVLRREAGYFDIRSSLKPLMHLWSLGIEEQFYLSYPLFLWVMWRLRTRMLAPLVVIAIASFTLNVVQVGHDAAGAFFLPQTRCWELTVGCAIACWQLSGNESWRRLDSLQSVASFRRLRIESASLANSFALIGITLIVVAVLRIHESEAFPGWWALLPVWGAALLILAGPDAWINRRLLSNKPTVFIGLISYPLYLWHWPILTFPRILSGGEVSVGLRTAGVLLSCVLAWATFRFVESPIRFGKKSWIAPVALMAASMVIAGLGYAATRDGFVGRFPGAQDDLGNLRSVVWSTSECRTIAGLNKIEYCRITSAGSPDAVLIGDSHAAVLYDGLTSWYQQRSLSLMNLGEAGCAPFYDTQTLSPGRSNRDCKAPVNAMIDFAVHAQSVRTIILSARGPRYMSGVGFGAVESGSAPKKLWWEHLPQNSSQSEMYVGSLHNTLSLLNASGKKVVLFVDWPELGFDPRSCLIRPHEFWHAARSDCSVSRSEVDTRNQSYRDEVLKLEKEFPAMEVFDPLPYLCDSSSCYAMREGHLLYSDDNHVSLAGARYLAARYFEKMP